MVEIAISVYKVNSKQKVDHVEVKRLSCIQVTCLY